MIIAIKRDVKSPDENGAWGYNGAKSGEEIYDFDSLREAMAHFRYEGLHELLVGERYRPYADVEKEIEGLDKEDFDKEECRVLYAAQKAMERLFPDGNVVFFRSSSWKKNKISGHFIVNDIFYTSKAQIRYVLEKGCDMKALHMDTQVYDKNKTMRLPLCSKPGQKRPLKYAELKSIGGEQYIKTPDEDEEADLASGLITYVQADDEEMPIPEGFIDVREEKCEAYAYEKYEQAPMTLGKIQKLVAAVSDDRVMERANRRVGIMAIRQLADYQKMDLRQVAHQWAKKAGDKYDEAKVESLYNNPGRHPFTFDCIIGWAKRDGFKDRMAEGRVVNATYYEEKNLLLEKPNLDTEMIQDWMIGCLAFIEDSESWFCRFRDGWKVLPGRSTQPFPFATLSSASHLMVPGPMVLNKEKKLVAGKPVKLTFKDILMELKDQPVFKQCRYTTRAFVPYFKESVSGVFNTFPGWSHEFQADMISENDPVIKCANSHALDLFGGDKAACEHYLNMLACKIQRPMLKTGVVGIYSKEGTGKNIEIDFLKDYVYGPKLIKVLQSSKSILGDFNSQSEGKLWTVLNECKENGESIFDSEKFKTLATEVDVEIRGLYQDFRDSKNYSGYIGLSNNKNFMKVGQGRRFLMGRSTSEHIDDTAHFEHIVKTLHNMEAGARYFNWLAQRDLTDWQWNKPPATKLKTELMIDQMSSPLEHLRHVMENKRPICQSLVEDVVSLKDLHADYQIWCREQGIQVKYVSKQLSYKDKLVDELGLEKPDQYSINTVRKRGFLLNYDAVDKAYQKMLKIKVSIFEREEVDDE